jgi:EAL domain-containing protein (putative c-di-GMP-specific phosphodiesterase class I)
MATTAEGVETLDQLAARAAIGCSEMQRYLFSPAVPAEEIPKLLARLPMIVPAPRRALPHPRLAQT